LLNLAQRGTIAQFVSVSQATAIFRIHGDAKKREQEQFGDRLLILKGSHAFVHSSDSKRVVSMLEKCTMISWAARGPNKDREMSVFVDDVQAIQKCRARAWSSRDTAAGETK